MDPVIPPEIMPEAVLTFSPIVMVPVVAGIVQVLSQTGMPLRLASLTALVLGVVLGVASAVTAGLPPFVGLVQGAVVGLAASGLWLNLSSRVKTNGD
jgi:hypothetical protein